MAFNPFNDLQIFSCSGDGSVKLWNIPNDGYVVDCTEPFQTMSSSIGCPFRGCLPNPVASDIIVCRSLKELSLFDVNAGAEVRLQQGFVDLQSMAWSHDGSILLTTAKDKTLSLVDMRNSAVTNSVQAHANHRNSKCVWLGDSPYFATTAHSAAMDREMALWDHRQLSAPVRKERIDSSTGALMAFFDADNNLLTLAGKGDSSIRFYEFDASTSAQFYPICNTPVGDAMKGLCQQSKHANDRMACEIQRYLKVIDGCIQPVTVSVPRKEKLKYHEDLFSPTYSGAPAALSAERWLGGENALPEKIPFGAIETRGFRSASVTTSVTSPSSLSVEESKGTTLADSNEGEEVVARSRPSSAAFGGPLLKYRHMYGKEFPRSQTFYNLSPAFAASDSPLIACTETLWAVPWKGAGGQVYVSGMAQYGKVELCNSQVISGHRAAVLDLAFCGSRDGLLATASDDCTVKVWDVNSQNLRGNESLSSGGERCTLPHANAVRCCLFHPTADAFLATGCQDGGVRFWDVSCGTEVLSLNLNLSEGASITNISFDYHGTVAGVACKDKVVRVIDPRSRGVSSVTPENILGRNLRVTYCSTSSFTSFVTSCSSSTGLRRLMIWDPRNMSNAVSTQTVDNGSGALFPMFDEDTGLLMVAGKGDTIVRYYEVGSSQGLFTLLKSGEYQTGKEPISGICMVPKKLCDVRNVEVTRLLKLSDSAVLPIGFILPRADNLKSFFQDDIYTPTRTRNSFIGVGDWLNQAGVPSEDLSALPLESLCPEGMTPLSAKPVESPIKSKAKEFREVLNKAEEEKKQQEESFLRLQNLAIQRAKYHPNPSGGAGGHGFKVDAAPVHDSDSDNDWS